MPYLETQEESPCERARREAGGVRGASLGMGCARPSPPSLKSSHATAPIAGPTLAPDARVHWEPSHLCSALCLSHLVLQVSDA